MTFLCFTPSPSYLLPWSPLLVTCRRRTRLQASPLSSLSRSPWTGLKRNSSSCRRSITGACRPAGGGGHLGGGGPFSPGQAARAVYLVLVSRRWRVESQLSPVIHVTPLSWLFLGRPFCCLLLLPLFPLCAFAAVPGSPFSCILELHENRQYLHFIYLFCNRLN